MCGILVYICMYIQVYMIFLCRWLKRRIRIRELKQEIGGYILMIYFSVIGIKMYFYLVDCNVFEWGGEVFCSEGDFFIVKMGNGKFFSEVLIRVVFGDKNISVYQFYFKLYGVNR